MPKVVHGVNPVDVLNGNINFMLVQYVYSPSALVDDFGYINVHTGCYIFPIIEQPKFFSKEYEYTGSIWVCWNQNREGNHDRIFSGQSVIEFLKKINI